MFPILFKFFNIPVYSFGLFLALGFIFALISLIEVGKKFNLSKNDAIDLSYYSLIAGVVGARCFYIFLNYNYYLTNPMEIILLNKGGLVYYGGFIGGFISAIMFINSRKISFLQTMDMIASVIPIGQMFGRIGCFLNGCCFGTKSIYKFKVSFPIGSPAFNHYQEFEPIHPVQLYESFGSGLIFLFLITIIERKKFNGQIICLYGILYPILRFSMEFFRADNIKLFDLLTISQIISIFIFFISLLTYFYLDKKSINAKN